MTKEYNEIKDFKDIPFTANIPLDKEVEMDIEIQREMIYEKQKMQRIEKTFAKVTSNLRRVADYIYANIGRIISYKEIADAISIPENSVRLLVAELNYYKGFPITMMPVPNKPGHIQSVLNNDSDYEVWDRKKMKTITSMNQVRSKASKIVTAKKRTNPTKKIPVPEVKHE